MVRCNDGKYYVGVTNNVEARVYQHNAGEDPTSYTHERRPVVLVYASLYFDVEQAIRFEKILKGWSRPKKEALIAENWPLISRIAHSRPSTRACSATQDDKHASAARLRMTRRT